MKDTTYKIQFISTKAKRCSVFLTPHISANTEIGLPGRGMERPFFLNELNENVEYALIYHNTLGNGFLKFLFYTYTYLIDF